MVKNRRNKIIIIVVLCISVIGLTLGFAAFSNALTISSGATVSPNRSDFKLVAYGIDDASIFDEDFVYYGKYRWPEVYTSDSISKPFVSNMYQISGVSGLDAKIESSVDSNGATITFSNLHANMKNPGDDVFYNFLIKNEGEYDAYLLPEQFNDLSNINDLIVCKPIVEAGKESASESSVDKACEGMYYQIDVVDENNHSMSVGTAANYTSSFKVDKYGADNGYGFGYLVVVVCIRYNGGADIADGDFLVELPEISLEFTTAPPAE